MWVLEEAEENGRHHFRPAIMRAISISRRIKGIMNDCIQILFCIQKQKEKFFKISCSIC